MKLLITGAAGFLGSECVRQARHRRHHVVTTDRRGTIDWAGDLAEPDFCATLPDVDAIIHAAAVQYVSPDLPTFGRRAWFQRNNVAATRHLTERYADGTTFFVNIGTSMMYEQSGLAVYTTGCPMAGQGVYSESKLAAQTFITALPNPAATVIPCIIGGTGRAGLFKGFVRSMQRFGAVAFPGRGEHKTHMVHVEDAAALAIVVAESGKHGWYNCAGPAPLSILEWVREIEQELGLPRVRVVRVPLAPVTAIARALAYIPLAHEQLLMLRYPHVLDTTESLALGWKPRYTNADIVRETARSLVR